ncbi:programmed cell death 1 ligand 1-like isoform X2 [Anabas testudineus]|uniref:programmed cell death 1 ligand 1-like isoform X2 n=1 Tax=Anabas testudineus TaxID=64144 RepID=UPI000E45FD33|nr:programmed cell death 1 ligand 1-like isoform X2 [Anabas testudineus]
MTAVFVLSTFLSVCLLASASDDTYTITAGQTAILPCREPNNFPVTAVEWTRDNLEDKYVLFYRDKQLDPDNQHPSFKNRVELDTSQMKHGDVSLILKNVTVNDSGRYECHIIRTDTHRNKRATFDTEPINTITLRVVEPGNTNKQSGIVGLAVGLSAAAVVLIIVAVVAGAFVIYRKRKISK